jgi:hypothetical protein
MIERRAIWLFAFCNVVLYASVLPLWEGFDEPFHYGYVQYLWTQHQLPVIGKAALSEEVWNSLHTTPGSYLVKRNLPFVETFEDWFRRGGPRDNAPVGDKFKVVPSALNYEAQQAPLAYVMMTVPDMLLSHVGLPLRICFLRVLCGSIGIALFLTAMMRLIDSPAAWFCALCVQMLYATVVHISNDWIAVGLAAWFVVACAERRGRLASVLLTVGLLTKAYFLAFVPLLVIATGRRIAPFSLLLIAVPWYARNVLLYGNVSGVFITNPKMTLWQAATSIDWAGWMSYIVHAGLWTGNNSFTSFSRGTLDLLLVLLAAGVVLRFARGHTGRDAWATGAPIMAMAAVLVYSTVMLRAYTGGETTGTGPWYIPAILAPLFALSFGGLGRVLRVTATVLSGYILVASYWVKLLPMYGGFVAPRSTLSAVITWYNSGSYTPAYIGSSGLVYSLAVVVTIIAVFIVFRLSRYSRAL